MEFYKDIRSERVVNLYCQKDNKSEVFMIVFYQNQENTSNEIIHMDWVLK